jgi:hypothetical protein
MNREQIGLSALFAKLRLHCQALRTMRELW